MTEKNENNKDKFGHYRWVVMLGYVNIICGIFADRITLAVFGAMIVYNGLLGVQKKI